MYKSYIFEKFLHQPNYSLKLTVHLYDCHYCFPAFVHHHYALKLLGSAMWKSFWHNLNTLLGIRVFCEMVTWANFLNILYSLDSVSISWVYTYIINFVSLQLEQYFINLIHLDCLQRVKLCMTLYLLHSKPCYVGTYPWEDYIRKLDSETLLMYLNLSIWINQF